ncbi:PE-PPE domain-containing protein [Mycobacterium asiaticum]|uniref:PE-PPE domain-containing protein n=1 Tax=Mycobacterium asiaticum TaxID=1790 RepID=UPI0028FCD963|nr:PE-PPE domain-containing protein [Mycobacterium asiaticum]
MTSVRRATATLALTLLATVANITALTAVNAGAEVVATTGATVLTLDPAFRSLPGNWLRGELFAAPNVVAKVPYNNFPSAGNVHQGSLNLNNMLHAIPGPKVVVGHSEGAQVEDDWLRTYGPTSDIDPASVTFILTGDPEGKYGGCMHVRYSGCTAAYGGNGFPIDTRYTVKVVIRQYDFWADCPANLANATAVMNRFAAMFVGGAGQYRQVHGDYSNIGLNDPGNKTYVEGNATYILGAPATYYLPMVTLLKILSPEEHKRNADMGWRPAVEAAYYRPMGALPPPT